MESAEVAEIASLRGLQILGNANERDAQRFCFSLRIASSTNRRISDEQPSSGYSSNSEMEIQTVADGCRANIGRSGITSHR